MNSVFRILENQFELNGYYNKNAYLLGQKANVTDKNPFEPSTNSWYNWNKGKNEKFLHEILPIQNK